MLTDTHAHIHYSPLKDDIDGVLKRAEENNVGRIVTIGTALDNSRAAVAIAEKYPHVYAAIGVHPHDADKFSYKELGAFEELASSKKVIGIGEVGLDFYRNISAKAAQIETFSMMIDLALGCDLPIIIHCREAAADTLKTLDHILGDKDHPILFHCFSGEDSLINWGLARKKLMFSFAGNVTYPKATQLHEALNKLPIQRLFVETDCPYLAPVPLRGKENEPAFVVHTAKYVAEAKGLSVEQLATQLEENFTAFFRI